MKKTLCQIRVRISGKEQHHFFPACTSACGPASCESMKNLYENLGRKRRESYGVKNTLSWHLSPLGNASTVNTSFSYCDLFNNNYYNCYYCIFILKKQSKLYSAVISFVSPFTVFVNWVNKSIPLNLSQ